MGDFLHSRECTPYSEAYLAADILFHLSTNSLTILKAARASFFPTSDSAHKAIFAIRLWVDPRCLTGPPWPKPYVRGLDHIVYAGFAPGSSLVIDLKSRRIAGRVSQDFAADTDYWNRVVFPMMMSITAATAGIVELHCACVARDGHGLLLAGPTRSGKSTLSVALSSMGFGFLADDRTLCSFRQGELCAYGLLTDLKLRSDGISWFSNLANEFQADGRTNGRECRLAPETLQLTRARQCKASIMVFLERDDSAHFDCVPLSIEEVKHRIQSELMAELPEALDSQSAVISALANLPCFLFRYTGHPSVVARNLASLCDEVVTARKHVSG